MVRDRATRVVVIGAGRAGRAAAASAAAGGATVLLLDKGDGGGAVPGVRLLQRTFAVDLLVADGRFAGVETLSGGVPGSEPASVGILATGGVAGLFLANAATGDGLAMAARAGAHLAGLDRLRFDGGSPAFEGGVRVVDHLSSIENLLAVGEVAASAGGAPVPETEGARAGERAARLAVGPPPECKPRTRRAIDEPLPPGFVEVKFGRLRDALRRGLDDPSSAIPQVLRLKGEADDFARARKQQELYELQNACEVAMLLLKARKR